MLIGNIIVIPLFLLFIYFMSIITLNEKFLSHDGKFAPGINIPNLKVPKGYKINRVVLGQFLTRQTAYFSGAMWLGCNLLWYIIENKVLDEMMATWLFMAIVLIAVINYVVKIMSLNKNIEKFIIKGEKNE